MLVTLNCVFKKLRERELLFLLHSFTRPVQSTKDIYFWPKENMDKENMKRIALTFWNFRIGGLCLSVAKLTLYVLQHEKILQYQQNTHNSTELSKMISLYACICIFGIIQQKLFKKLHYICPTLFLLQM